MPSRLFIDPASISTGWALFNGRELISHGTLATQAKDSVFKRLGSLFHSYASLFSGFTIDEVHLEQLPRRCHHFTHWSVGVIGTALTVTGVCDNIKGDLKVKSWQKHVGWEDIETQWEACGLDSEDEFAAICMGRWYVETQLK